MTREEAIERFEKWAETAQVNVDSFERLFPNQKSLWRKDVEYYNMAISALRAQQEKSICGCTDLECARCTPGPCEHRKQPNAPLTLDELRKMDGEPAWCVSMLNEQSEWAILKVTEMSKTWFIAMAGASCGYGDKDTYGKTWLAYRRKPEEGTS